MADRKDRVSLTELIDVETLQLVQDSFSEMTGLAIGVSDEFGRPVTKGAGTTAFCMDMIRNNKYGRHRCLDCDSWAAQMTYETGKALCYTCHAGLTDFSAPIIVNGQLLGAFVGGQSSVGEITEEQVRKLSEEYGFDFEEGMEAATKVPVVSKEKMDSITMALGKIANAFSEIAAGKRTALSAKEETEKVASMKSDFLANMSHEIRTPMNAVIGMAEMALREEMSPAARNYINQIKSSGRALLGIINDILDFSKIDSGKMDIIPVEYEPLSMFNDVANILVTRLQDKNVELLLEINPNFPSMLYGDNLRVRQVLINLANNAVKFTSRGSVKIEVDFDKTDEENVLLKVWVKDTGTGIKEEDLGKIFQSFQQVDSKRNRNIEGTGLGLAITQQLLGLMHGRIEVESEYGKGSTFYFEIPQRVLEWKPSITVKNVDKIAAAGMFGNRHLARQFYKDTGRLGVYSMALTAPDRFDEVVAAYADDLKDKKLYIFMEEEYYEEVLDTILSKHPDVIGVELADFYSKQKANVANVRIFKKPMSSISIAMALNDEEMKIGDNENSADEFDFTAPDAKVLIVDDNAINLTVAEGLLDPLCMQTYSATSGKMALDLIEHEKFDLIFMDHMMPELDGVETTRLIRRMHLDYADVPILALTANAVEGMKELFLSEGMNDFVPKPIEVRVLVSKVKKWLPAEKIIKGRKSKDGADKADRNDIIIGDLDTATALKLLGNEKLFWNILREYYRVIDKKAQLIREYWENGDIPAYTIEVHALKSASRQIGAMKLADLSADLEAAGHEEDIDRINMKTADLLTMYESMKEMLEPFCREDERPSNKKAFDRYEVRALLEKMLAASEELDMDLMEETVGELGEIAFDDQQLIVYDELKKASENVDVESCLELIDMWKDLL